MALTEKNWLIRTSSGQILGPVSREKIKLFYQNGSLNASDEISTGNGFWFWVKEKQLVEKYLVNEEEQCFNPVSEARSVLTEDPEPYEAQDDEFSDDLTLVGRSIEDLQLETNNSQDLEIESVQAIPAQEIEINEGEGFDDDETSEFVVQPSETEEVIEEAQEETEEVQIQVQEDEEQEEEQPEEVLEAKEDLEEVSSEENSDFEEETLEEIEKPQKKGRSDSYLFYLIFAVLLLLAGSFVYYRRVLRKPFPLLQLINSAQASQTNSALKKKAPFSP